MCGICGWLAGKRQVDPATLDQVRDSMAPRGPDAAGSWIAEDRSVGLGHRRLAILGLSPLGNQPMESSDGRFVIVFNGEVYNFRELAQRHLGPSFEGRTGTDTEVVLELLAKLGPDALPLLRGMFAIAVWDRTERTLLLARDFAGIKPLYYARTRDGGLLFASQTRAILRSGLVDDAADPKAQACFLLFGHLLTGFCWHREVREVPPGHWIRFGEGGQTGPVRFDSLEAAFEPDGARPLDLGEALRDTVRAHFVSDVPVSVFLSAGKDSTTLLALSSEVQGADLRAVTLGFEEYQGTPDDEVPIAREVAGLYGAHHQVALIRRSDFRDELPRILEAMDRPSIDGVNTYFVCRAAASLGVKVALSGLGGDELLGGYPSFGQLPRWMRLARPWRRVGRAARAIGRSLPLPNGVSPKAVSFFEYAHSLEGAFFLRRGLFLPWELEGLLGRDWAREALRDWDPLEELRALAPRHLPRRSRIALLEMRAYMIPRLLVDSDWASMAHSLELRVPLVDRELYRAVGPHVGGANPPTKDDLVRSPQRPLPPSVTERPKTGFQVPVREWLGEGSGLPAAHSLRDWARLVLARREGFEVFEDLRRAVAG